MFTTYAAYAHAIIMHMMPMASRDTTRTPLKTGRSRDAYYAQHIQMHGPADLLIR